MAKKTRNATTVSPNWACFDGGSRKDKCSGCEGTGAGYGGASETRPLCYGNRQEEELLCLWRIWAHGLQLQEPVTERKGDRE